MPIYEYECEACGDKFELIRSMSDRDDGIECPKCGNCGVKRVFSVFGLGTSSAGESSTACSPTGKFT